MTALTELVVMRICPACNASGCRACNGTGRVPHDPYGRGAGEQGWEEGEVPRGAPFDEPTNGVTGADIEVRRD
jgi:hypothetical protein